MKKKDGDDSAVILIRVPLWLKELLIEDAQRAARSLSSHVRYLLVAGRAAAREIKRAK